MKRIGVIFGGRSGEHEVSLLSAASVIEAIDRNKYQVVMIGITREGQWKLYLGELSEIPSGAWEETAEDITVSQLKDLADFIFPVLHGPYGEDGTIQGLFEMLDMPYAGCGVLASALCMDKVSAKKIFEEAGLPTSRYKLVYSEDLAEHMEEIIADIEAELPYVMFVKPSNMGSSVGISKVRNADELRQALLLAAKYDRRIIIEEGIDCREVETGVIGNHKPQVAAVGEIVAKLDFYDYAAKYTDDSGTEISIPAQLPKLTYERIRTLAKEAYRACDCSGFSRIDFFVDKKTGEVYINEINTIPGFTKYSMFPKMWEEMGVGFTELIERIVEFGYERYYAKNNRQTVL
ncbi:D-alanine--D-alanine ligase family protein [Emergencia sp. 1XD21-10]|uniref:D-alanine--D-alanine ligase family protein n=1 Tax=Emergencia sp. 1XD21-10 TaxID=2304569 RepID=UPI00192A363C|nr:D-alanine--D-alanine ligase family protein [Emergencia sp. 1XD21-10]